MLQVTLALVDALRNGRAVRHGFLEMDHPASVVRVWTGWGAASWQGHDWLGVGALGSIGEIADTKETVAHDLSLGISGIDPAMITLRDGQLRGRPMTLWVRWLDQATGAWFTDSAILFQGVMDTVTSQEQGGKASMALVCRSPLFNWSEAPHVYYSNEEQQLLHPGDTGFDRMADIPTKTLAGWELT